MTDDDKAFLAAMARIADDEDQDRPAVVRMERHLLRRLVELAQRGAS